MQDRKPNLFTRDDTLLGVCEGLGEDFGINANLLRLAFAGALFFNATWAIGTYLALGVVVALTRWLVSKRDHVVRSAPDQAAAALPKAEPMMADNDTGMKLAA
jgi:phage shock protein PspC (stress-responsive transcriptional regulator)